MLSTWQFRAASPPSSPWNLCCHQRLQEKNSSLLFKHPNVKYIPLKQITGYHRFSANNVQIILRQLIAMRQTEVTCLILLKQWNKKLLAKQTKGNISIYHTASLCTTNGQWRTAGSLAKGGWWIQRISLITSNRQEEMLFQLRQQRKQDWILYLTIRGCLCMRMFYNLHMKPILFFLFSDSFL